MITFDYYRIFYFVAQYQSFSKAAELLHNNQPNITRCMNNLEEELQCRLLIRSNKGVTLTEDGKKLYQHVAIACEHLLTGEKELKERKELKSGCITIGATETALRMILLDRLESFHECYPDVQLKISTFSTPNAILSLQNNSVDFAIVTSPVTVKKPLIQTVLHSFSEVLIGGMKYKDLTITPQTLAKLSGYPLIGLGPSTSTYEFYMKLYLEQNLPYLPDMEASSADQILPMVMHNLGLGFCPLNLAQTAISEGFVYSIPLTFSIPKRSFCLISDSRRPYNNAVHKLISDFILS